MNIEQEFFNKAVSAGIEFDDKIIANGLLQRSHIKGHKRGTKNGAYVIFPGDRMAAGWGMDHTTGHSFKWRAGQSNSRFSIDEQTASHKAQLQRQQKEALLHQKASVRANKIWHRSILADCSNVYLQRKHVHPHGTKVGIFSNLKDILILPLFSTDFALVNLQFIQPNGTKRFLSGGKKKGCFWWIGDETKTIFIAEGFATAASVYEHAGMLTFIAFDAGNLEPVARTIRQKYPSAELIIAGDNDQNGVGQFYAKSAALAVNGKYIIPTQIGSDWNDVLTGEVAITGGMQ
jgi:putative DNA primase/helicase